MRRFKLINQFVTVRDVEMLLVMIERTDEATIIHWRVPVLANSGFARAPHMTLGEQNLQNSFTPMKVRNSGGTGTESHMVDVYSGRYDSDVVIRDADDGTLIFQEIS